MNKILAAVAALAAAPLAAEAQVVFARDENMKGKMKRDDDNVLRGIGLRIFAPGRDGWAGLVRVLRRYGLWLRMRQMRCILHSRPTGLAWRFSRISLVQMASL